MKLESKYDLGDIVWSITDPPAPKIWVRCTFCEGYEHPGSSFGDRLQVVGADGETANCPVCKGYGGESVSTGKKRWELNERLTIGLVQVRVTGSDREETYMCKETGVGSGRVYYVHKLYADPDAAQRVCDMRNELIEVDDAKT